MPLSNLAWSRTCAEFLSILGVRHVCISPGSRNSPLTIGFTEHKNLQCFSIIDERSSAFFALGIAKSTQVPTAVLSTSGTAAANFYPAVIEANLSRTPLLILTADRPPYLINTGANQTIDQHDLYGRHIRTCIDMGLPSSIENLATQLRRGYLNAAGLSHNGHLVNPPGPVHLNFPFAEPLIEEDEYKIPVTMDNDRLNKLNINPVIPIQQKFSGFPEILERSISDAGKLLLICGEGLSRSEKVDVVKLAEFLNAPVLADALSGLRFGLKSEVLCSQYEGYTENIPEPDLILRFGKKPISLLLNHFMDLHKDKTLLFDPVGRFNDDAGQVHSFSVSEVWTQFSQYSEPLPFSENNRKYLDHLQNLESAVNYRKIDSFSEENIVMTIFDSIPEQAHIFIGNSLPIRHVDKRIQPLEKRLNVFCSRGASGIDGVSSTALGMAASFPDSDNYLLIGDVSFFHDLNGLHSAQKYSIKIKIIILNNRGGKIFNRLPYANYGINSFDEFWITDTKLSIEKAVKLFNGIYRKVDSLKDLRKYMLQEKGGLQVYECQTE